MSTNESSIHLIDSLAGEEKKADTIANAKFTHHESCIMFSSDREVKYLSCYDNKYLRYFWGHSDVVTSLCMNPIDDTFITASEDRTVRLWSLSSPNPTAKLQLPAKFESPYATFDASGVIFGVLAQESGTRKRSLKLYDARNFSSGPFEEILPEQSLIESAIQKANPEWSHSQTRKCLEGNWTGFEFSTDGNHILVSTQSDLLLVLDGFRPDVEPIAITSRKNEAQLTLGCTMSPNAETVVAASEDNEVMIFDYKDPSVALTGRPLLKSVLTGHVSPVGCIACNPKYDVMATGCVNTVLWIPKVA
jgi:COMPASS component SWD2